MADPAFGNTERNLAGGSVARLGQGVRIEGKIYSDEDLHVDGEVEGTIDVPNHRLVVGPNGRIKAEITAREIVVLGSAQGSAQAQDRFEIHSAAKFTGDVKAARIIVQEGAYFKGSIDILQMETSQPREKCQTPTLELPRAMPTAGSNMQPALPN